MSAPVTGGLLGLLVGLGVALAVARVPVLRRPTLEDRLAPYLRDAPGSRLLSETEVRTPFPTLERLLRPVLTDAVHWLDRLLGGAGSVRSRLDQLGRGSVEQFRTEQLAWGVAGVGAGLVVGGLAVAGGRPPGATPVLAVVAGLSGVLLRDRHLTRQVTVRQQRIMIEFPTVAELLALSVAAGEGPVRALERVADLSHGELARELRRTLADARAGASLVQALDRLAARTALPALRRFVDGVVVAVERGTPLSDVLRAQAIDAREAGRRSLIESGARREIAMMVPVVFLVLPISVVFALFPAFYGLTLSTP